MMLLLQFKMVVNHKSKSKTMDRVSKKVIRNVGQMCGLGRYTFLLTIPYSGILGL